MSFNPMPMNWRERKYRDLEHAQRMLDIIDSLGSFSQAPLAKFDYGQQASALSQAMNTEYINSLLNSHVDRVAPSKRGAAVQRRYNRRS